MQTTCGIPGCPRPHYATGRCQPHYDREWYLDHPQYLDENGQRTVSLRDIANRDGWVCARCGSMVDDSTASGDHFEAKALAKKHGRAPDDRATLIRLTHKLCNSKRGARPAMFSARDSREVLEETGWVSTFGFDGGWDQ